MKRVHAALLRSASPTIVVLSLTCAAAMTPAPTPLTAGELTVHADFPGGSAKVVSIDAEAQSIEIEPAVLPGQGWPCWWYCRIEGAKPGSELTLKVAAAGEPFRPGKRLAGVWALPRQAAISEDDVHWQQTEPGQVDGRSGEYRITVPAETFWIAWGPPFVASHAEQLLDDVAAAAQQSERFILATSRGGRPVQGIRLGSSDAPAAIWVQARQHAWESGGSWVGNGFIRWVVSDDPDAKRLRETTEIYFIPIMDIDNVEDGAGGKEAVPRDHNRDWDDSPVYPEVAAAQQQIKRLLDEGRLRVYLDLHNPSAGERRPYFFGPLDFAEMTPEYRGPYERFLELATEFIRGPLAIQPRYSFATYVKTEEERNRVSGNWVRNRSAPGVIAMTLETAWNTPHSTIEGYRDVGSGLAKTVARFLQE